MAESADYIRQILESDIGQAADEAGVAYWQGTGLRGDDLVRAMRYSAGMDTAVYNDPAYAAFARTLRQRHLSVNADRDAKLNELRRNRLLATARLDQRQEQGLEQVDMEAASRGMYNSGGRIDNRSKLLQQLAQDRAELEVSAADDEANTVRAAADEIGSLSRQRDEEEVAARGRMTAQSIADEQAKRDRNAMIVAARSATQSSANRARDPRARAPRQADRPGTRTSSPTRYVQPTGVYNRPTRSV